MLKNLVPLGCVGLVWRRLNWTGLGTAGVNIYLMSDSRGMAGDLLGKATEVEDVEAERRTRFIGRVQCQEVG